MYQGIKHGCAAFFCVFLAAALVVAWFHSVALIVWMCCIFARIARGKSAFTNEDLSREHKEGRLTLEMTGYCVAVWFKCYKCAKRS